MTQMTYPDGEVLAYGYDNGGLLREAYGTKRGNKYVYVKGLSYDEFGQRKRIEYGNGVTTTYDYDLRTRRLSRLLSVLPAGKPGSRTIQDIAYDYDLVGNILLATLLSNPTSEAGTQESPNRSSSISCVFR